MELFKACEKEMKTKAFSKEGLSAAVKLDPMDVLKEEMSNFISETVTELGRQIEVAEAEVESLQGGAKKKRGAPNERIAEVEALNERRRWHVSRLELILRLLENGQIPPTKVADIQTDVKYFLESNTVRRASSGAPLTRAGGGLCRGRGHLRRSRSRADRGAIRADAGRLAILARHVVDRRHVRLCAATSSATDAGEGAGQGAQAGRGASCAGAGEESASGTGTGRAKSDARRHGGATDASSDQGRAGAGADAANRAAAGPTRALFGRGRSGCRAVHASRDGHLDASACARAGTDASRAARVASARAERIRR